MLRFHLCVFASVLTLGLGCGPRDPADIPAEELVQSGCETDDDCEGGRCISGIGEGLCTANCESQDECPEGTVCTDTESPTGVCLLECSTAGECTDHLGPAYTCDSETNLTSGEDVRVCIDGR